MIAVARLAALLALALPCSALATAAFSPTTPLAVFDDASPLVTDAAGLPLWDRVELHQDADATLFIAEDVAPGHAWDDSSPLSPHLASLFGSSTPASDRFLLHFAPGWALAPRDVPVLLVPGASTSASGVCGPMARFLAARGRAVFAISFAHPHGDAFAQAEQVADAIARIQELTGAAQVDLVAHSKGGVAAAIYLGHRAGASWGADGSRGGRYAARGTPYRGDVRRFVAVAVPFGGVDTVFRWTASHVATGLGADPVVPSAWTAYYPMTTTVPAVVDDLRALDLWPEAGDPFPGQAQLLARWDAAHALPGSRSELGVFALQQDWYTTYEGGYGFYSAAPGIDDAIEVGGGVIARLAQAPAASDVSISVLAGRNPLIPVDQPSIDPEPLGGNAVDWLGQDASAYRSLIEGPLAAEFPDLEPTDAEVAALSRGDMMLGEISGRSDGLLFVASATATGGILAGGAELADSAVLDLSHLDLLFAGSAIGQALIAQGQADPDRAQLADLGARYVAEDALGWIALQLERGEDAGDDDDSAGDDDDSTGDDDDSTGDDDDSTGDDDDSAEAPDVPWTGCSCAATPGQSAGPWWALLGLVALRRRRATLDDCSRSAMELR